MTGMVITGPATVLHEDAASDAACRFLLPHERDLVLGDGQWIMVDYDPGRARWMVTDTNVAGLELWAAIPLPDEWN